MKPDQQAEWVELLADPPEGFVIRRASRDDALTITYRRTRVRGAESHIGVFAFLTVGVPVIVWSLVADGRAWSDFLVLACPMALLWLGAGLLLFEQFAAPTVLELDSHGVRVQRGLMRGRRSRWLDRERIRLIEQEKHGKLPPSWRLWIDPHGKTSIVVERRTAVLVAERREVTEWLGRVLASYLSVPFQTTA
jgi:hypothetical protein